MKHKQYGFGLVEGLIVVLLLLVLGFSIYNFLSLKNARSSDTKKNDIETTQNENDDSNTELITTLPSGWVWYENETVGFRFGYPEKWGEPTADGNFSLHFGGDSYDDTLLAIRAAPEKSQLHGDGPWISNTQGYNVVGDKYYSNWGDGKTFLISDEDNFKELDNAAVLWTTQCPFTGCNQAWMKGSFNTNKSPFSGIGLLRIDYNRDTPRQADLEEFEAILNTLERL